MLPPNPLPTLCLNRQIIIIEPHIPRPLPTPHHILVPDGALVLRVPRQHALHAHADALHVLDGAPAGAAEQVEADDAVAVDVRVHGDGPRGLGAGDEDDFGDFDGVVAREAEAQAEGLREVDGVRIQDLDVHVPFGEVGRGDEGDAGGEGGVHFGKFLA